MKISMIPFGLLSGFMDSKEIRLTELEEEGFRFRLAEECPEPECFLICFYDMKKAGYRKVEIRKFEMNVVMLAAEERRLQENSDIFFREYSVKVEQKDYVQEVQRLAGEYSRYIRLKLNGDDGELAKSLTGYPAELDEVHCRSLEEQKRQWFFREGEKASGNPQDTMGEEELKLLDNTEFALELNCTSLYEEYLRQPLQAGPGRVGCQLFDQLEDALNALHAAFFGQNRVPPLNIYNLLIICNRTTETLLRSAIWNDYSKVRPVLQALCRIAEFWANTTKNVCCNLFILTD